jgi:hypothetical protein
MVGASGFEPLTTRTPSVCATRLRYAPTAVFRLAECNIAAGVNQFNVSLGSDSNSAKMSDFDWSVISSAAREIFFQHRYGLFKLNHYPCFVMKNSERIGLAGLRGFKGFKTISS